MTYNRFTLISHQFICVYMWNYILRQIIQITLRLRQNLPEFPFCHKLKLSACFDHSVTRFINYYITTDRGWCFFNNIYVSIQVTCTHLADSDWFRKWLVAWPAPSYYLNQCWNFVDWTLENKLQWNLNRNSNIFVPENAFETVVCEMVVILSLPQCVKGKLQSSGTIRSNTKHTSPGFFPLNAFCDALHIHELPDTIELYISCCIYQIEFKGSRLLLVAEIQKWYNGSISIKYFDFNPRMDEKSVVEPLKFGNG